MAQLPLHPRLAGMVIYGRRKGCGALACDLAALIGERDFIRFAIAERNADVDLRVDLLQAFRQLGSVSSPYPIDHPGCRRIIKVADDLCRRLDIDPRQSRDHPAGPLLAAAYPDRIGRQRAGRSGRFLLANGRGAFIDGPDPLAGQSYLVAAKLDGDRREAKIFLAAACDVEHLSEQFAQQIQNVDAIQWDIERRMVVATRKRMLDALTLSVEPQENPDPEKILMVLLEGIRTTGIARLPWSKNLRRWQQRVMFVRRLEAGGGNWPDVSDAALSATLEHWLGPYLSGIYRLQDIDRSSLRAALQALLDWRQRQRLDQLAPTHVTVPSGSRLPVDYSGTIPLLAVRIQEMFGLNTTPAVAGGRQPLLLHLLSPAGRPAQVTSDLAGFWQTGYHEVKKELKGRYPKHHWPDDPLTARPTARAKPRK
jgi:ATP-dependent helicase HrpB